MYQAITAHSKQQDAKLAEYERIMRLTSANLRDLAGCLRHTNEKEASALHELADRLYNATIHK